MTVETDFAVPQDEITSRIAGLQEIISARGMDGALIVQKTDLYYYSGTSQLGWLYIPGSGQALLMVYKDFDRARLDSPLPRIVSIPSIKDIPAMLAEYGLSSPSILGMELDVLPYNQYQQFVKILPYASILDISTDIRLQRSVKSDFELGKIRKSAALATQVTAKVPELLQRGKPDIVLAGELESYARSLGHQGIIRMRMWGNELFYGHLMSGAAAAVPSYLQSPTGGEGVSRCIGQGAGFKKIGANEPVIFDYVFAFDGYLADHSRVFSLGPIDKQLQAAHQAMLELEAEMKKAVRPGAITGELYDYMTAFAERRGLGQYFMGIGERKIRFTSHGLGLELDEFPFIAQGQKLAIKKNMVIAMEPKIIFPGIGVVGIENTHIVNDNGLETLTCYPDDIKVLSV